MYALITILALSSVNAPNKINLTSMPIDMQKKAYLSDTYAKYQGHKAVAITFGIMALSAFVSGMATAFTNMKDQRVRYWVLPVAGAGCIFASLSVIFASSSKVHYERWKRGIGQ